LKILAIDTSTKAGSVALTENERVLAEANIRDSGAHAAWLLPAIDTLLRGLGMTPADVDLFAVAIGPGSFTGLRIGISTIKGLAWPLGKPVVGVSTLKAMALNFAGSDAIVCPLLDARKREVYTALYRTTKGGEVESLVEDSALTPDALFRRILTDFSTEDILFFGEGLKVYEKAVSENLPRAGFAPTSKWYVKAENVASLALAGDSIRLKPEELSPLYIRKSEAELKRAR
jgi:tRNA threonylcarbamoyladenosine biosynthesis protein TsaB